MAMTSIRVHRWAPVVLLLLAASACGGAAPPPAATSAITPAAESAVAPTAPPAGAPVGDVCPLLTVKEVAAARGSAVDSAVAASDALYAYCSYESGNGRKEVRTFVTANAQTVASVFGTMKINKGEAVAGVGDEAFWSTDSFMPGLYFVKGGKLAYISGSATEVDQAIVGLGKLLASRL